MENKIDLSKCVKGQKVRDALGQIEIFDRYEEHSNYPYKTLTASYTREGFYSSGESNNIANIVEILPLEQPEQKEEVAEVEPVDDKPDPVELYDATEKVYTLLYGLMKQSMDMGELDDLEKEIDFAKRARQLADDIHSFYNL